MKNLKDELLRALANNNETTEDIEYLAFEDNDDIRYIVYQTKSAYKGLDKYRQNINGILVNCHKKEGMKKCLPQLSFFGEMPPVVMYTKDHIYFSINDHEKHIVWGAIYSIPRNPDPTLEELGFDII